MAEWPSGLRCSDMTRKMPVQTRSRRYAGYRDPPRYEAPGKLRIETLHTQ